MFEDVKLPGQKSQGWASCTSWVKPDTFSADVWVF